MSVNTSKTAEKPSVKLPVIIVAAVALIVLLGWLGHRAFSGNVNVTNELTNSKDSFMAKVAKEAGPTGDVNKINPADREKFLKSIAGAPRSPQSILKAAYQKYGGK